MLVQMFTLQVESEDRPSPGDRRPVPSLQPPTEGRYRPRMTLVTTSSIAYEMTVGTDF